MAETLIVERTDGVMTITLNRPEVLNAVNDLMARELREALRTAAREATVRCLVITGAGRGFCSGQDLRDRAAGDLSYREHLRATFNPLILQIHTLEKPVLAAVNGVAAGAGCSLALAADLRIASDRASFIELFARIGLVPDSGSTWFLPRLVGLGKAFEMTYTTDPVDAQEAYRIGLVNRVVPHDDLLPKTMELAGRLAAGPTKAYGLTKRALHYALGAALEQALEYEAHLQEIAGRTADHREGVAAFLEKRPSRYTGQ
ncbi:MAG: enoyl-CoA hydratase-related protein [Armatimonadota bacterium]|nr:enoyl-CoA hydratase-related protein [Armatimonadota bacterium]MDR7451929.1 enoyl-CoA hydratase-related protein [Armatimonadota bacterium]MDR7466611.1 enoyl-CoA hydratase-related protein [Armatimonadota bacterium]MDR7492915.1 enoyl-CoA hydratase-related protein [Armatimonadota bacterium]MDR7500312.1 enoyl-CoA hydratase-related protein [Armatimonadota bacterium]